MTSPQESMLLTGAALIAIELVRSVPAWLRVRGSRSGDGVSPVSVGVLAGTGFGWIAVAVLADSVSAAIASAVWLVFHLLLCREVMRADPAMAKVIGRTAAISCAVTFLVALAGFLTGRAASALGTEIVIASAFYCVPALLEGMRSRTTAGLSVISLLVNSVEGAIYLCAGAGLGGITEPGRHIPAYVLFGVMALASNIPRLTRASYRRALGKDASFLLQVMPGPLDGALEPADPGMAVAAESREG